MAYQGYQLIKATPLPPCEKPSGPVFRVSGDPRLTRGRGDCLACLTRGQDIKTSTESSSSSVDNATNNLMWRKFELTDDNPVWVAASAATRPIYDNSLRVHPEPYENVPTVLHSIHAAVKR